MTEMKPLGDVEKISGIAFGFMASKALFSALHMKLFDVLADGPRTAAQVAAATQATQHGVETLLTGLAGLGLVSKEGDAYRNSEDADLYLVTTSRHYYGDYLTHQIDQQMYPFMGNLNLALEGRTDDIEFEDYETWMADKEQAEIFSRSQHGGSLGPGKVVAKLYDLSGARKLLDVGGGTGAFSIMMCRKWEDLQATILDFPNVAEVGEPFVNEAGLGNRVTYLPGNALKTAWPAGQDVVLMSYLFSGIPADALPAVVANAWDALEPGGRVIIHDFMVDDDRAGPPLAALWALQHLVFTPGAASLTPGTVKDMLATQGFAEVEERPLIPGMTRVVSGVKPKD